MTAPAMTQVEYEELIDRAKELEQPIVDVQGRGVPTEIPQPVCALPMAITAATVLAHSAENAQHSLELFETTRKKLAQALRNAASAYLVQDEAFAKAISDGTSASGVPVSGPTGEDSGPAATSAGPARPDLPPEIDELHSLEDTAFQLEQLDQGESLERFAEAWSKYQDALRETRNRFRPLKQWQGKAADAVNRNFEDHRAWLDGMVTSCAKMAEQAQTIVNEFPTLRKQHVISNRKKYDYQGLLAFEKFWTDNMHSGYGTFMRLYTEMAKNSETLLADFKRKAGLPLTEIYTTAPRDPSFIEPPPIPGPTPYPDPGPGPSPDPSPDDGGFQPFVPPLPSALSKPPTGQPTPYDPNLSGALASKGTGGPRGGGGIKPAAFGGAMPLQSPTEEAARPAGAEPGAGNRGHAARVAAGAMGAGMGGGAPGQGGRGGSKGKRVQAGEDAAVYTEEREWTEGLIGRRRVKDKDKDKEEPHEETSR